MLLPHLVHSARCMVDFVSRTGRHNINGDKVAGGEEDGGEATRILREGTALIQNVTSGMNAVIGGHARCTGKNGFVFYYVSASILCLARVQHRK